MTNTITNCEGTTFSIGSRVEHTTDRWRGIIIGIRCVRPGGPWLLRVEPDDFRKVPGTHALSPEHAAKNGHSHWCHPRDCGLTMGNYRLVDD